MCAQAGREVNEVAGLVAAGNTTMTHFFLGLDVQSIPREPYIPLVNRPSPFYAQDIGLKLAPTTVGWMLPNVGSYFGGDLVAGIVAADLHQREDPALLVGRGNQRRGGVGQPRLAGGLRRGRRSGPGERCGQDGHSGPAGRHRGREDRSHHHMSPS